MRGQMNLRNTNQAATLRPATAADLEAILQIEHASFANPRELFNRRQIRYLVTEARAVVTVAEAAGLGVVGWAAGLIRRTAGGGNGRVYALAVHPKARGMSLGRRLMEHTIAALRRGRAVRVFLEVRGDNHAAIALYRKLGFVDHRTLRDYYGRGLHALRMLLDGPPA